MHISEEDYIKAIYEMTIEQNKEMVRTHELSLRFNFTDQTVNEMVKRLATKNFIVFSPYKGVSLTESGTKEAVRMIRSHRIWEVFLIKTLGFDWSEVHKYAEELEHISSEEVVDRLYEFLNYPEFSHDGQPIPKKDEIIKDLSQTNIYDLNIGDKFRIVRLIDIKGLLNYLNDNDIKLYDEFVVENKNEFIETIEIKKNDKASIITKKIGCLIFVEKL